MLTLVYSQRILGWELRDLTRLLSLACFQHLSDVNWPMRLSSDPSVLKAVLLALHMALILASKSENVSLYHSDQLDFAKC
jgi:hypothetical protein